jgi:hypothetical protein
MIYTRLLVFIDSDWSAVMIQCKDCEFCEMGPDGRRTFKCDPFVNIKEPECLAKWQLIRLDMLVASYQQMLKWYGRLAPIQDKIIQFMQREIEDIDEADSWKLPNEDEDEEENDSL